MSKYSSLFKRVFPFFNIDITALTNNTFYILSVVKRILSCCLSGGRMPSQPTVVGGPTWWRDRWSMMEGTERKEKWKGGRMPQQSASCRHRCAALLCGGALMTSETQQGRSAEPLWAQRDWSSGERKHGLKKTSVHAIISLCVYSNLTWFNVRLSKHKT